MSNKSQSSKKRKKSEVSGSETILEKMKSKTPWIFGESLRKPKIKFPRLKARRAIDLPSPSKNLGLILIFIVLFVLQTGILYIIYREPPAVGANADGEPIFLYPNISYQFIIEGIIASIVIFLSSLGYLLLYQASKYVYDRNTAIKILALGFILILVSFVTLQIMLGIKTQAIREFLQNLIRYY
jgi:hypothetical protein